ncbi:MAG TPA: nitroreductase family protein [Nitrosopumilaceae archaeon]|nr:nitroreductase family protein [Nitrosopumilaceae archaeon]
MISDKTSFFELISTRHSVRKFKERVVSNEIIEKILTAANKSPSAGNLQSYEIFIVTKKEDKKKLAFAAHEQNFIEKASAILVFCANPDNVSKEYGSRGKELYCIQDATIACSYSQLAAHYLELSSVWVGSFDEKKVAKFLSIQNDLKPVAMLVIGFADEEPEITSRKALSEIIHRV